MRTSRYERRHAAGVASVATGVGMACFILLCVIVNSILIGRDNSQVNTRLKQELVVAQRVIDSRSTQRAYAIIQGSASSDGDDVPVYVWRLTSSNSSTAITPATPELPQRSWSTKYTTRTIGRAQFRFDAVRNKRGWIIAAESLLNIERLNSSLITAEVTVGVGLLLLMFLAAFVIGVRALAPISFAQRRQSEFTADASHELRTPLSVIEAEVDLALSRHRDERSYRSTLERIREESYRLKRIVDDLMWLARSDEERRAPRVRNSSDVGEIAQRSSQRFNALADASNIKLTFSQEGGAAALVGATSDALDRLVGVLLDNACKFAGANGRVHVSVLTQGHRTILRIADSGPGIPEDQRTLIFNRFHHTDAPPGGTGLGLAIADTIIQSTGATCAISTSHLGGAQFEIVWRRTPA
ncbi:MAG: sensor histidine kinase [Acidimicrobiales bacterium]